jgi:hypothetical protein
MAADSPPIKAPDIPRTASKVSQSQYCRPNDNGAEIVVRKPKADEIDATATD